MLNILCGAVILLSLRTSAYDTEGSKLDQICDSKFDLQHPRKQQQQQQVSALAVQKICVDSLPSQQCGSKQMLCAWQGDGHLIRSTLK